MQPLPPTMTTRILVDAARGFERAAGSLGSPASASELLDAARSAYQTLPSLRMTTTGSRELYAELENAAASAMALSEQIGRAPAGADWSAQRDSVLGWARLAEGAALLVEPAAYDA